MKKSAVTLILFLLTIMSISAAQSPFTEPDFAYPKQVSETWNKELDKGLKTGDDPLIVRSLLNVGLAEASISPENRTAFLKKLSSIIQKQKSNPTLCALLDLMQAEIYNDIYRDNARTYDKRQLPLTPLPADYNEWSGDQFRLKINDLLKSALSHPEVLHDVKLDSFNGVITPSRYPALYPTLLDFVAYRAINLTRQTAISINSNNEVFNLAYDALLKYHPANSAPHFLAYLQSGRSKESAMELYTLNKNEWYSGLALLKNTDSDKRSTYFTLKDYVERFPSSPLKECVEDVMKGIMMGSISTSFKDNVAKGGEISVDIYITNIKTVRVSFFSVKNTSTKRGNKNMLDKLLADTVIDLNIEGPFHKSQVIKFTVPDYGLYTVIATPADKKVTDDANDFKIITCTDLMLMSVSSWDDSKLIYPTFIANLTTGRPLEGVCVRGDSAGIKPSQIISGVTNADGFAQIQTNRYIYAAKGADKWSSPLTVYNYYSSPQKRIAASITTSLPIYKFGDTVEWFAAIYNNGIEEENSPVANKEIDVTLLSANNTDIKTVTCATDEWGRISGKFNIPESGLAGNFSIKVSDHKTQIAYGFGTFVVSDYKLPTFTVEITDIDRDSPEKGAVTISGVAQTYANFPVAGADVNLNINITTGWNWWNSVQKNLTNIETITDSNGRFSAVIPAEEFEEYEGNHVVYANVSVTSQGGETRFGSSSFVMGKPYCIISKFNNGSNIDTSSPVNLGIGFSTPTNQKVQRPVNIKFFHISDIKEASDDSYMDDDMIFDELEDSLPAYTFTLDNPSLPINLSAVKSGVYSISIAPVDTTLADPLILQKCFVYNKNQKDFPIDKMVWTPYSGTIKFHGKKGELLVGTSRDNLTLLCMVASNNNLLSSRWISFHKGMNHVEISIPDSITQCYVTLAGANNGDTFYRTYTVVTPDNTRKLEFKIESFRDKVSPLSTENWKFKSNLIAGADTVNAQSAVMLRIFSKAINDLTSINPLTFNNHRTIQLTHVFTKQNNLVYAYYWSNYEHRSSTIDPFTNFPIFEQYSMDWMCSPPVIMARGFSSRVMAKNAMATFDGGVEDMNEEMSEDVDLEDAATAGANTDAPSTPSQQEMTYRSNEVPLALFEPMLLTNPDGTLEYSVTFPDASTTWLLNATAFNKEFYSASINKEIVAAHPLMIQISLPRFMRLGDTTTLVATIMNNSGENLSSISTLFEAIDPSTGKVVASAEDVIALENGAMKVVSMPLSINNLTPGLLIRARANGGNYADGEQAMIAVLEASQPVVETKTFFLNPDQKTASIEVETGDNAKVTLEFYQNPTWSVVTALPGLRSGSYTTAMDAAGAIASAAIAEDLLNRTPAIGTAIRQWLDSDRSDSTLVSMLQRNPDLRIALLEATPWMTDAMNDTQRMQRLALLFDRKEIKSVYSSAIHKLAKLQRSKGWGWNLHI